MNRAILVIAALLVGGCAPKAWHHPDPARHTQTAFLQDRTACMAEAGVVAGNSPTDVTSTAHAAWRIRLNNAFGQCMRIHGWEWR
jgi:hypothetical protein